MLNVRHSQVLARFAMSVSLAFVPMLHAQAPAASPARQSGTVKAVDASSITVVTQAGAEVKVPVAADAIVVQTAPGATNLTGAQPVKMTDIAVGDRVIVGKAGDTATASRVVVMKSSDIAARNQAEQADWAKRGTGGIVKSVDGSAVTISSGSKTIKITTTPKTVFRRYAADSIKFQDSKAGTLDQIKAGDQLSVRGDKSEDGLSVAAEEVVTGTFANLSGVLTAVDATAGTVSFKDLTTKKPVTVKLTANSDIRQLPPQMAAMFAGRSNPAAGGAPGAPPAGGPPAGGPPAGGGYGGGAPGGPGGGAAGAGRARAGMDLSRMLSRLPTGTVSTLKNGDAVMIVASPGGDSFTAITLLSGVEALLTAPAGAAPITLSPWNLGTPDAGGGPQ
jgi:hypothetical protein